MRHSRLFEDSVARHARGLIRTVILHDKLEKGAWQVKLAAESKLSLPSLYPRPTPFITKSMERQSILQRPIQLDLSHHFPALEGNPVKHFQRSSSHNQTFELSPKLKQMVMASPPPRSTTGLEFAADGVAAFGQSVMDVRSLKDMTKAYSSITQFYDHAGTF
jgi:hypothetical protein